VNEWCLLETKKTEQFANKISEENQSRDHEIAAGGKKDRLEIPSVDNVCRHRLSTGTEKLLWL
jgi:hypothetical protein